MTLRLHGSRTSEALRRIRRGVSSLAGTLKIIGLTGLSLVFRTPARKCLYHPALSYRGKNHASVSGETTPAKWVGIPAGGQLTKLLGHRAMISNQLSSRIIFGNWADMIIGMWSGLDINVDTATLSISGGIRIVGFFDVDVVIRHAESFSSLAVSG